MGVLSSIILLIIFFTGCSNSPQDKIIGEWETGNLGSSGTEEKSLFIFKKDLTGTVGSVMEVLNSLGVLMILKNRFVLK